MPGDTYSTYEAKARFSEVLRKVRDGRRVTITYHGTPVAELRPISPAGGTSARLEWLRDRGVLEEAKVGRSHLDPLAHRPGALQRFLDERE